MFAITSENVISQIESYGRANINYKVDGFWSSDQITIYISRYFSGEWEIRESHSSGGQDSKFEGTEAERTRNFASAMMDAADVIEYWSSNIEELNAAEVKYKAATKAYYEEQERLKEIARKEKAEADRLERIQNPSMGTSAAMKIADELKAKVLKADCEYAYVQINHRKPSDRISYPLSAEAVNSGKATRFYINGQSYSKVKFIELLAKEFVLAEENKAAA